MNPGADGDRHDEITVAYRLSFDEFREAFIASFPPRLTRRLTALVVVAAVASVLARFTDTPAVRSASLAVLIVASSITLLVIMSIRVIVPARVFRRNPAAGAEVTVTFDRDGVSVDGIDGTVPWADITAVERERDLVLVKASERIVHAIPTRALDPTDLDRIDALAASHRGRSSHRA